jgi:hypothetical protein
VVPSRWFSREGPFVGARYALEIAYVQLRPRRGEGREENKNKGEREREQRTENRVKRRKIKRAGWGPSG